MTCLYKYLELCNDTIHVGGCDNGSGCGKVIHNVHTVAERGDSHNFSTLDKDTGCTRVANVARVFGERVVVTRRDGRQGNRPGGQHLLVVVIC